MTETFKKMLHENSNFKKEKGTGKEYELKNAEISAFGNFKDSKNDIIISAATHAKSQAHDRRPEFTRSDWEKLHKKVTSLIDADGMYDDGWKLFYSKSMKQGYIAVMEYNDRKAVLNVKVITVLPKGKNNPQGGNSGGTTELELMESANSDMVTLIENIDSLVIIELD